MREFSYFNDGYNYLLYVIDCYSKFAWCQKLKTKTGVKVKKHFKKFGITNKLLTRFSITKAKNSMMKKLKIYSKKKISNILAQIGIRKHR